MTKASLFDGVTGVVAKHAKMFASAAFAAATFTSVSVAAPPSAFVPGRGTQIDQVGDDFEDPSWGYRFNNPKSSEEIDEQSRQPLGKSTNGRWFEGAKRGHPDIVRRVDTPLGGLPGSFGAMLLQSRETGIPNRISNKIQQDDFIANVQYRVGGPIDVDQSPSFVTRIFLPPIAEWEPRSGPHFAFRAAVETTVTATKRKFLFSSTNVENEIYWPGLFICLDSKHDSGKPHDYAYFRVRADRNGGDFRGPDIAVTGWWTLGMSFSSDGMVHYYGHPGVEDLTEEDYMTSQYPYGYRCERVRTFFYNIINVDNGRSWSSPLIVDDTYAYVGRNLRFASRR